jgi:hypothetical protein
MNVFAKIKGSVNAPKTEDTQYDEARAVFKSHAIDAPRYATSARALAKAIKDLSTVCLKAAADVKDWIDEEAPAQMRSKAMLVYTSATQFDELTTSLVVNRIEPNFVAPVLAYQISVDDLHKIKIARMDAVKEYDKAREYHRLLETAKKPKKADIDKAKIKSDESQQRYAAANQQFIDAVAQFAVTRRTTLGDPFRSLLAIFCQYIRKVTPSGEKAPPVPASEDSSKAEDHDSDSDEKQMRRLSKPMPPPPATKPPPPPRRVSDVSVPPAPNPYSVDPFAETSSANKPESIETGPISEPSWNPPPESIDEPMVQEKPPANPFTQKVEEKPRANPFGDNPFGSENQGAPTASGVENPFGGDDYGDNPFD